MTTHFFPTLRHPVLRRPRLTASRGRIPPALLVLRGGAGAGKTLAALDIATGQSADRTCVWVRAQREESAVDFWQRLLRALVDAGLYRPDSSVAHLALSGVAAANQDLLVDALAEQNDPILVVIDDLHLAGDPAVQHGLTIALERLPGFTLVATTREPLVQLTSTRARMAFPVREITEDELSFTEDEVRALLDLRSQGAGAQATAALAAQIYDEAQGWPLASDALVIELGEGEFRGEQSRSPAWRGRFVSEYANGLIERAQCPEMLWASALMPECSPAMLAYMLETPLSEAERFLSRSTEAGLSRWVDSDEVAWYYHHDLIRLELRRRARMEAAPEHLSRWYRRAAEFLAEIRPRDAVQAAINGQAWDTLSTLLIRNPAQTFMLGRKRSPDEPWLGDISKTVREAHPVIEAFALLAEYAVPRGRFQSVFHGLKVLAGPGLAEASQRTGLTGAVASVLRMVAARLSGNEELSLRMAERADTAISSLSSKELEFVAPALATTYTQTAITYIHAGRHAEAAERLQRLALERTRAFGWHRTHGIALAALSAAAQGRMGTAGSLLAEAERIVTPVGWQDSYVGAGYRIAAAFERLEAGSPDEAETHLEAMAEHAPTIEHWPYLLMLETLIAEQRYGAGEALLLLDAHLGARHRRSRTTETLRRKLMVLQARLAWAVGRAGSKVDSYVQRDLVAVYRALARNDYARARTILGGLLSDPGLVCRPRRRAETLLLQASLAADAGDRAGARVSAQLAASVLSENGLTLPCRALSRSDLERLREFAPALDPDLGYPGRPEPPRPLTAGEQRALTAVAEHGSASRAAQALYLSPNTLRSQLKSAYRKLGVHSRDDAIRTASAAGLLPQPPITAEQGDRDIRGLAD